MQLNMSNMSPTELQFIRLYCLRLRLQHDSIRTVMALMNPTEVGINSPIDATRVAESLKKLGDDFDTKLVGIQEKHGLQEKRVPKDEKKFLTELADIFALSFFKIVLGAETKQAAISKIVKDGWCSGEPVSWAQKLDEESLAPTNEADVISAIAKFFSNLMPWVQPAQDYKNLKTDKDRDEEYEEDEWYDDD